MTMKKQGLIAGFALTAAMAFSCYGVSAASGTGPVVGDMMPDDTIYAGISPDTHKPLYTTRADAPGTYSWEETDGYCRALEASGYRDWKVPTKDELNLLYKNRGKGALKGTFNETGSYPAGWYWSSTPGKVCSGWAQNFSTDTQLNFCGVKTFAASLRCVR
jgi:hypothetical protein